jgi:hypothetical protein
MSKNHFSAHELRSFERSFDVSLEDRAIKSRAQFLQKYPRKGINSLTLDEYVIGKKTETFCKWVEWKTEKWAYIQGATSYKFGIYFGKTKSDPKQKYRFAKRFGSNKTEAFKKLKRELLNLLDAAKSCNFLGIDENQISQLFKSKILSLYFPEIFLNVCSKRHLKLLASKLRIAKRPFVSEYQHLLMEVKQGNTITKSWSNPKFMYFLYNKYIPETWSLDPALKKRGKQAEHRAKTRDIVENHRAAALRDYDDEERKAVTKSKTITYRNLHNKMTNALKRMLTECKLTQGRNRNCRYDVLVEDYDRAGRDLLIEAKPESDKGSLRIAVGQLLDYRRFLPRRAHTDLAVLTISHPAKSYSDLLLDLQISPLWFTHSKCSTLAGKGKCWKELRARLKA